MRAITYNYSTIFVTIASFLLVWGLQQSCAGRKWRLGYQSPQHKRLCLWVDSASATYAPHTAVEALKLVFFMQFCAKYCTWFPL